MLGEVGMTVVTGQAPLAHSVPTPVLHVFAPTVRSNAWTLLPLLVAPVIPAAVIFSSVVTSIEAARARRKASHSRISLMEHLAALPPVSQLLIVGAIGTACLGLAGPLSRFGNIGTATLAQELGQFIGLLLILFISGMGVVRQVEVRGTVALRRSGYGFALWLSAALAFASWFDGGLVSDVTVSAIGALAGFYYLNSAESGRLTERSMYLLLLLSMGGLLLWTPIRNSVFRGDHGFLMLSLYHFGSTLWLDGLLLLVFAILPLRHLPGRRLIDWSGKRWLVLAVLIAGLVTWPSSHPAEIGFGNGRVATGTLLAELAVFAGVAAVFAAGAYGVRRRWSGRVAIAQVG